MADRYDLHCSLSVREEEAQRLAKVFMEQTGYYFDVVSRSGSSVDSRPQSCLWMLTSDSGVQPVIVESGMSHNADEAKKLLKTKFKDLVGIPRTMHLLTPWGYSTYKREGDKPTRDDEGE